MASATPTVAPPQPAGLSSSLERNIHALAGRRKQEAASATFEERIADAFTSFAGSMRFVYLHMVLFGAWIGINLGLIPGVPRFDPSLVVLAMAASVEAIFLSTFVLISQNRMSAATDKRADLDLHISLLAEHELTKLAVVIEAIAARLDVRTDADPEMDEIKRNVAPEAVLDAVEAEQKWEVDPS